VWWTPSIDFLHLAATSVHTLQDKSVLGVYACEHGTASTPRQNNALFRRLWGWSKFDQCLRLAAVWVLKLGKA